MMDCDLSEHFDGFRSGYEECVAATPAPLYSYTIPLGKGDLLSIYRCATEQAAGGRLLWFSAGPGPHLLGIGAAKAFDLPPSENRAAKLKQDWALLTERAVVRGRSRRGEGPVLMGGFAYDPALEFSGPWSGFSNGFWRLPRLLFAQHPEGDLSLTLNLVPEPAASASDVWSEVEAELERLTATPPPAPDNPAALATDDGDLELWRKAVLGATDELKRGPLQKATLAREMRVYFDGAVSPDRVLMALTEHKGEAFVFSFEPGTGAFLGATPRLLLRKDGESLVATCLAGSIPRGSTGEEDDALGRSLLSDPKNRREHRLSVEIMAEKLRSMGGNLKSVPDEPSLLKLKDIQHLLTVLETEVPGGASLLDYLEGTLYGKASALEIPLVRRLEGMNRGLYGGPIGWLDFAGDGEMAIALRCGLVRGNTAYLYAGCGIISTADPEEEHRETRVKFRLMRRALER